MLFTRNLITSPNVNSYNTAVKQINEMDSCNSVELKSLYDSQQTAYNNLQSSKDAVTNTMDYLSKLTCFSCGLTKEIAVCVGM